jgi:hypothetical protein
MERREGRDRGQGYEAQEVGLSANLKFPRNGLGGNGSDLPEADFGPASKSAIKCRIRSAVTQAEAAIANSLHR